MNILTVLAIGSLAALPLSPAAAAENAPLLEETTQTASQCPKTFWLVSVSNDEADRNNDGLVCVFLVPNTRILTRIAIDN